MPSSKLLKKLSAINSIHGNNTECELIINTDSRKFTTGETFVALRGENFDGRKYLESVLKIGARAVVFECEKEYVQKLSSWVQAYPETLFICASDSLKFLQELASEYILEWKKEVPNRKIIGITGSNGKTTHKEMMFFILQKLFPDKILATHGNLNNHIGVPLTIFTLTNNHDVAIIEMGMNHPGEIAELTAIAHPEHGMITNVGPAHIEFMKSTENIFKEKSELYNSVLANSHGEGVFTVNADDTYLVRLPKTPGLITYGENTGDVKIKINPPEVELTWKEKKLLITNQNISERHNLKNLAGVAVFLMKLYPEKQSQIIAAASEYSQPEMNRSQWIDNIFLDAYNANPSSMRTSLNSFVETMKSKNISLDDCYFVLGDMNELGEFAPALHKEIAEHAKDIGIKNITFIGRYRKFYLDGFSNPTSEFATKEEFIDSFKKIKKDYRYVFVKASRSLQLETLAVTKKAHGFTLIELMIVVAMLAGLSLVVMNITGQSTKTSAKLQFDTDITLTTNEINAILSDPAICLSALGSNASPTNIAGKYFISTDASSPANGYGNSNFKIDSYSLTGTAPDGVLTILYQNKNILKSAGSSPVTRKKINMYIEGAPGGITMCRSLATSNAEVWSRGAGSDIYYSGGNVGIETNAPADTLDINGGTRIMGQGALGSGEGMELAYNTNSGSVVTSYDRSRSVFKNLALDALNLTFFTSGVERMTILDFSGNVGIGTASPSQKLEVLNGDIQISNARFIRGKTNTGGSNRILGIDNGNSIYIGSIDTPAPGTKFVNNSQVQMYIDFNGKVGIGTIAPAYKLDVSGDINTSTCFRLTSGTTVGGNCTSDARLKDNIEDFNSGLYELLGIRIRSYYFNGLGEIPRTSERAVGVIAQEVEQTNPSLVKTRKVKMHPEDLDLTEIKSVDYSKFTYMLINGVKQLYHKWFDDSVAIHNEIAKLKNENAAMKSRLEKIEQALTKKIN
jgi:UDP-N-acetylmuramoyl-tripeptide--D-alanyl-D-alanine ligase